MCAGRQPELPVAPILAIGTLQSGDEPVSGTKLPTVPRRRAVSVLSALGVSADDERRYRQVLPLSGAPLDEVAATLRVEPLEVADTLAGLTELGIVRIQRDRVVVLRTRPGTRRGDRARGGERATRPATGSTTWPAPYPCSSRRGTQPAPGEVENVQPLDGELSSGGNALELLTAMIEQSRGDLLFLRPDAWLMPRESAISEVVGAHGRLGSSFAGGLPAARPARGARGPPARASTTGEEVRLIDDLPTRLMIIGATHAILPEPLGFSDSPRLLVRQGALVSALTLLFELYWEKAMPVSELSGPRSSERTFLLRQLLSGAKDEQIARTMGLSLRTVRRRIAELMIELGADTRFQAGAEAVRRGWL